MSDVIFAKRPIVINSLYNPVVGMLVKDMLYFLNENSNIYLLFIVTILPNEKRDREMEKTG